MDLASIGVILAVIVELLEMANTLSAVPPLPSYKNPPVIEVSFGTIFSPLSEMQTRHFGQFWTEHKSDYPKTKDLGPLLDLSRLGPHGISMDVPPLRRMMCFSDDEKYVAQVQDSRLHLNWRKIPISSEYPRYPVVSAKFQKLWKDFGAFADREGIGPLSVIRYELVYVNHVELGLGSSIADLLEEYVKLFCFSPIQAAYLSPPESVNTTWNFAMPEQRGTATASLSNATNKEGQNLLVLVFTCNGAPSEKHDMVDWFQSAHEWIVRSFTELTTDDAHQKWGRER